MKAKTTINGIEFRGKNLVGEKFGRLTVTSLKEKRWGKNHFSYVIWECRCACGTPVNVPGSDLKTLHTRSCGCLQSETTQARNLVHGHAFRGKRSPLYDAYQNMIQRCYDPNATKWPDYGGRGIKVCSRWRGDFRAFLSDMQRTWEKGLTLDRIKVNGDYGPSNCRWATHETQANNKRGTRYLTLRGVTKSRALWAREFGIPYDVLKSRSRAGWSDERTLLTPV